MSFEGAFQCSKCPRTNDPAALRACPAWMEVVYQATVGSDTKVDKGCFFELFPRFMLHLAKATYGTQAQLCQVREEVLKETKNVSEQVERLRAGAQGPRRLLGPKDYGSLSGADQILEYHPGPSDESSERERAGLRADECQTDGSTSSGS